MIALNIAYPFGDGSSNEFVDYQTGEVMSAENAFERKYAVYSYEECQLIASGEREDSK